MTDELTGEVADPRNGGALGRVARRRRLGAFRHAAGIPMAVMMATWFQGPFRDFIRVTQEGWDKGVSILHFLGGSAIELAGQRAIAQTKMTISQRGMVEGSGRAGTVRRRVHRTLLRLRGAARRYLEAAAPSADLREGPDRSGGSNGATQAGHRRRSPRFRKGIGTWRTSRPALATPSRWTCRCSRGRWCRSCIGAERAGWRAVPWSADTVSG